MVGEVKTNRNGNYSVQVRVNPGRLAVNANATGFAPQSIIVDVSDGSRRTADLAMIPVQVTQPFRPENNAAIKVDSQTVVSLSANALVTESGGAASGEATAMVTVLDASKDPSVMPGDLESYNADTGEADPIESFGAMNVEFTGGNGNRLNLASGKQADISIPLPRDGGLKILPNQSRCTTGRMKRVIGLRRARQCWNRPQMASGHTREAWDTFRRGMRTCCMSR